MGDGTVDEKEALGRAHDRVCNTLENDMRFRRICYIKHGLDDDRFNGLHMPLATFATGDDVYPDTMVQFFSHLLIKAVSIIRGQEGVRNNAVALRLPEQAQLPYPHGTTAANE